MLKSTLLLFIFNIILIATKQADCKNGTKTAKSDWKKIQRQEQIVQPKVDHQRGKRSFNFDDDEEFRPFWANRGKKQADEQTEFKNTRIEDDFGAGNREYKASDKIFDDAPFWGNRGRRGKIGYLQSEIGDSSVSDRFEATYKEPTNPFFNTDDRICKYGCPFHMSNNHIKERREEATPFWGNRGRRNSDGDNYEDPLSPFWGNRGRRGEDDDPFWGARGRREDTPFWGNRGRREENSPFWGNRGRREEANPFWGMRGRREDEPFWGARGRRSGQLKSIAQDEVYKTIHNDPTDPKSFFWNNRGRDSKLKYLLGRIHMLKPQYTPVDPIRNGYILSKIKDSETVHDDSIFAEEPHFILVDRSSKISSAEDEPFLVSRGKKKISHEFAKAARDRRGIIEEIVKSVKTDPYYIARGKKGFNDNSKVSRNSRPNHNELTKTKELICSTIDLMNSKYEGNTIKRDFDDNERDRRTILKKLAAQLQADPYFVSRGKKRNSTTMGDEYLDEFIRKVSDMC